MSATLDWATLLVAAGSPVVAWRALGKNAETAANSLREASYAQVRAQAHARGQQREQLDHDLGVRRREELVAALGQGAEAMKAMNTGLIAAVTVVEEFAKTSEELKAAATEESAAAAETGLSAYGALAIQLHPDDEALLAFDRASELLAEASKVLRVHRQGRAAPGAFPGWQGDRMTATMGARLMEYLARARELAAQPPGAHSLTGAADATVS